MQTSINQVITLNIDIIEDERGALQIIQENEIPLNEIKRTFIIKTGFKTKRGYHAHKECSQLMVCLLGKIDVICDDSKTIKTFSLNENDSLLIPPGIWSHQEYKGQKNIMAVWCDKFFDEEDYIRDYKKFLYFKD